MQLTQFLTKLRVSVFASTPLAFNTETRTDGQRDGDRDVDRRMDEEGDDNCLWVENIGQNLSSE